MPTPIVSAVPFTVYGPWGDGDAYSRTQASRTILTNLSDEEAEILGESGSFYVPKNGTHEQYVMDGFQSPAIFYPLSPAAGLLDYSGNNRNLTTVSGTAAFLTGHDAGFHPGSLSLDGSTHLSTGFGAFTQSRTWAFWFRATNLSAQQTLFSGDGANGPVLRLPTTGRLTWINDLVTSTGVTVIPDGSIVAGNWYHIAFSFNSATFAWVSYLNGVQSLSGTDDAGFGATPGNLILGAQGSGAGSKLTGRFAGFAMWQNVQSAASVAELYARSRYRVWP